MKVNGEEVTQEQFEKLKEDQVKGKHILKEIAPGEYKILVKLNG